MNRNHIKKIAYHITRPFPYGVLKIFSNDNFIFPFYHLVAEKTPAYINQLYEAPTPDQFIEDLEFLLKFYEPASLDDIKRYVDNGKKIDKPSFFLSFDDGLKECFEVVYPILKQKGIQAAFFINPSFVNNNAVFYRFKTSLIINTLRSISDSRIINDVAIMLNTEKKGKEDLIGKIRDFSASDTTKLAQIGEKLGLDIDSYFKNEKPYMGIDQLKTLSTDGFLIGSHSMDHVLFSQLTEQKQVEQFEKSMQFIYANFDQKYHSFAFPYTDSGVSCSFFEYLGNRDKVDFTFGTAGLKHDTRTKHIQRIPMEIQGFKKAEQILRGEYAYYMLKSFFGRNKIQR